MKEKYIEIIEKSFSAYTNERIREYINEVNEKGISEHGFARLCVNMGFLVAVGKRPDLKNIFIEVMDICCEQIPKIVIGKPYTWVGNDFAIRELCCSLMLLEETKAVDFSLIEKWKSQLKTFVPKTGYDMVVTEDRYYNNWALFAAVSEYMRGVYCEIDTLDFVENQLPSQLNNLDCNGMYQDDPPYNNHMVYDLVPRYLFAFLLAAGYNGKYKNDIENALDKCADYTLKMQSVTGEVAFGGRSNQFLNNEPMLISYCEMEAVRFAKKGDLQKAGEFKAAAILATDATLRYLNLDPVSHIKNRYDISTCVGCESYGYFNKYMITVASNVYMAYMFCDESIAPTTAVTKKGGYTLTTSECFHKTFLNASGYQLEFDTNADFHYDANGLGRVHKENCPSAICLSVPFTNEAGYVLEKENKTAMSICPFINDGENTLLGCEKYAKHTLLNSGATTDTAFAEFSVALSDEICVTQKYTVSKNGVDISLSGCENAGFMVPVFDFDGANNTTVETCKNLISVSYCGSICRYSFEGEYSLDYEYYYNRNGRYRVYKINSKNLHIEISK